MTGQQIRQALREGKRVYGSCLVIGSLWGIAGYDQLDFAFIDNEHVPLGRETTAMLCQAWKARKIAPIVRIPEADPIRACMTLDAGAEGIICPYMEDPERVRAMVGAVKYRPLKGKKLVDFLRNGTGLSAETITYLEERNKNNVLIINVESGPAVEHLDELLAVEGLDGILIGPHDLSVSVNLPEQYEDPAFITAAEDIIRRARQAGIGAGIHYWDSLDRELEYIKKGANLIVHSTDVSEAVNAINAAHAQLRAAMGDVARGESGESAAI